MSTDHELAAWRDQWRASGTTPYGLRQSIDQQTRRMRLHVVAQILVTIAFGGTTLLSAWNSPTADVMLLAGATWLFLIIAWTFSMTNRRGTWRPTSATTTAFLDLFIVRCRTRRRALAFSVLLYGSILSFNLLWIYDNRGGQAMGWSRFATTPSNVIVWAVTGCFGAWVLWERRRLARQLATLEMLRQQFLTSVSDGE